MMLVRSDEAPSLDTSAKLDGAKMTRAAGIMFVTKNDMALFLKRGADGDHVGEWNFPGGKVEAGETDEQAAVRECLEEVGWVPDGPRTVWARRVDPVDMVDFTTFLQRIESQFVPTLDDENVGYAWAPVKQPPEPLHTGVRVALAKFDMDELGIARAMSGGQIASPHRYANMSLFALRITGTGVAYRRSIDEFVYRRPEHYLNDEFLARCAGLPVIMMHPEKAVLDSKEFSDRIVGTMLLPYVRGNEVWGIARIYDDDAVALMLSEKMSTSPTVVLRATDDSTKMKLEDGSTLLIEGKPALLDHLAICQRGVWDKGGEPTGVESDIRGDSVMTEAELKAKKDAEEAEAKKKADAEAEEARKKADAEAGQKLDKLLAGIDMLGGKCDAMGKRMDAFEEKEKEREKADKARKDAEGKDPAAAEKLAADKAKKDADDKEAEEKEKKEKEKADAEEAKAKKDAADDTTKRIADLEAKMPKQLSDADYASMADAQARADTVFCALGSNAPRPLQGETLLAYRRRLATTLKEHSAAWKTVDLAAIADEAAFGNVEKQIYADATHVAMNPADLPEGEMREIVTVDSTGRRISTFVGQPISWMRSFSSNRRRLAGIRNRPSA